MKALIVLFLGTLMATQLACKATKALDATIEMNGDMKKMLNKMDTTNQQMSGMEKVTDKGMSGMSQQMREMLAAMKEMLKLSDKAEDLAVALAFKETIKETFSSPAGPMAGAQELVKVASVEQLLDIVYLVTKKINSPPVIINDQPANKQLTVAEKISLSYGLNAIGYMIPPEKLRTLVIEHIQTPSERTHMAYTLLAYRAQILDMISSEKHVAAASDEFHMKKSTNLPLLEVFIKEVVGLIEIIEMGEHEKISHNFFPEYTYQLNGESAPGFLEYIKFAIENTLECRHIETAEGKAKLNDFIAELTPLFEKYKVERPNKQCP